MRATFLGALFQVHREGGKAGLRSPAVCRDGVLLPVAAVNAHPRPRWVTSGGSDRRGGERDSIDKGLRLCTYLMYVT